MGHLPCGCLQVAIAFIRHIAVTPGWDKGVTDNSLKNMIAELVAKMYHNDTA